MVRLMLGRSCPRIINDSTIPINVSLLEVLQNEMSSLSKSKEASRQRLLSDPYTAKDVVVRLPQDSPRDSGFIEWVLLKRQDRLQIAEALHDLSKDNNTFVQIPVLELAGELLRVWGKEDAAAIQEIGVLLKEMSANTSLPWGVRFRAQQALGQEG